MTLWFRAHRVVLLVVAAILAAAIAIPFHAESIPMPNLRGGPWSRIPVPGLASLLPASALLATRSVPPIPQEHATVRLGLVPMLSTLIPLVAIAAAGALPLHAAAYALPELRPSVSATLLTAVIAVFLDALVGPRVAGPVLFGGAATAALAGFRAPEEPESWAFIFDRNPDPSVHTAVGAALLTATAIVLAIEHWQRARRDYSRRNRA